MEGVICYKIGRNLNRMYRLCYTFGVQNLYLIEPKTTEIGNTFSASGNVNVFVKDDLSMFKNVVALEKGKGKELDSGIKLFDYILIGGENVTIKNSMCKEFMTIKTKNSLCLTADEALAIGLYYATR